MIDLSTPTKDFRMRVFRTYVHIVSTFLIYSRLKCDPSRAQERPTLHNSYYLKKTFTVTCFEAR